MAEQSLVCLDIVNYCAAILHTIYYTVYYYMYVALQSRANVYLYSTLNVQLLHSGEILTMV